MTAVTAEGPVLRWPGAKWRIAPWVTAHLPAHDAYIEPFFGSGAVFFNKEPSRVEIINDLDRHVVGLFRVLREQSAALGEQLALTPWSQGEYEDAHAALQRDDLTDLERARCLLTVTWQQLGRKPLRQRSTWRMRSLAEQSPITTWHKLPERVYAAAERLAGTQIARMPAVKLIEQMNDCSALIYADPPYLDEIHGKTTLYEHEMRGQDAHLELIDALRAHPGSVVLSAYTNDFYMQQLPNWQTVSTSARTLTNAQRAETLWLNPVAARQLRNADQPLNWSAS